MSSIAVNGLWEPVTVKNKQWLPGHYVFFSYYYNGIMAITILQWYHSQDLIYIYAMGKKLKYSLSLPHFHSKLCVCLFNSFVRHSIAAVADDSVSTSTRSGAPTRVSGADTGSYPRTSTPRVVWDLPKLTH